MSTRAKEHAIARREAQGKAVGPLGAKHIRAWGYWRWSPRPGDGGGSVEIQSEAIKRYVKDQGWTLVEILGDSDVSGYFHVDNAARPESGRLFRQVKPGDRIVSMYLDRLARSNAVYVRAKELADKKGARLVFLDHAGLDPASEDAQVMLSMFSVLAGWQRSNIVRRTREAAVTRLRAGIAIGPNPPFGWTCKTEEKTGKHILLPEPYEQAIIHRVLALHRMGAGARATARILEREGFLNRAGGKITSGRVMMIVGEYVHMPESQRARPPLLTVEELDKLLRDLGEAPEAVEAAMAELEAKATAALLRDIELRWQRPERRRMILEIQLRPGMVPGMAKTFLPVKPRGIFPNRKGRPLGAQDLKPRKRRGEGNKRDNQDAAESGE